MLFDICIWDAFHPVDFYLDVAPVGQRVGHFVYRVLVNLHAVDGEAGPRVQFLVTNVTFEMLRLLMLDQNLFVVEFPIAVPKRKQSVQTLIIVGGKNTIKMPCKRAQIYRQAFERA